MRERGAKKGSNFFWEFSTLVVTSGERKLGMKKCKYGVKIFISVYFGLKMCID
jgi:hypothetical protein